MIYEKLKNVLGLGGRQPQQMYTVSILEGGQKFETSAKASILTGAVDAGIAFPHSCGEGFCGTCKCKVVSGEFELSESIDYLVSREEQAAGYVLACRTRPTSDLVVSIGSELSAGTAKVTEMEPIGGSVIRLQIQLESPIRYTNGQYMQLQPPGIDQPRPYSIVTPYRADLRRLDFHVSVKYQGAFANWLRNEAAVGDELAWDGPHGDFQIKPGDGDIVCVASGSGAGVLWGMASTVPGRKVTVLGVKSRDGAFYFADAFRQLPNDPRIEVVEVDFAADGDDGYANLASEAAKYALPAGGAAEAGFYLCGPAPMVASVVRALRKAGVDRERILSDAFHDRRRSSAQPSRVAQG